MTEKEIHLKLSEVVIDNDNLDYIKMTGEICGQLRWDLVKLFAIPDVNNNEVELKELKELYNQKRLQKLQLEKDLYEANKLLIASGLKPNPIKQNYRGS